ncbi:recombinase family protein [Streptomyces iconiensis]|uniref:Recombinase family protein n=1 Tax=Streptomyces iconiensis TaxID=1384038 RepID=A0ABT6ZSB2_9ACTN|nr:recombinase family protein [Streptomyces iconiensis]MDJ1131757.1 recombinase family protein [Streptomyces iconiensis]
MTTTQVPAAFSATTPSTRDPYIGYIRVSTWKEEKISPEIQRTAILDWARRNGAEITEWIEDLDTTGRNFKRKIMRAIEIVEKGKERGIAVWRYSRFGRNRAGNAINLARVESIGGQLVSATEPIDATTAIGRFQRGMILEFAAFESDRMGEAWAETHQHRRSVGLPATGRPRFGYIWHQRWDARTQKLQEEWYEPDEDDTGPVCAEAYRRYVDGMGFMKLCGWLNSSGYRTTRGTMWTTPTLTRYMDSGFAAGLLRLHEPSCTCNGRKTNGGCPNYLYVQGAHEEIIEWDLWQAYEQRRKEIKATPPRARNALYELTGLPRCAQCRGGTSMTTAISTQDGQPVNVNGWAYRCSQRAASGNTKCEGVWIPRHIVERKVREWLETEAAHGVDAAPATPQQTPALDERARARKARAKLQAEGEQYDAGLRRLAVDNAMTPEKYPEGVFEAARDELQKKRARVDEALSQLVEVEEAPHRADFDLLVVGMVEEWPTLLTAERNAMLKQLIRRVALVRLRDDEGVPIRGQAGVDVQIHPVWKPDPWAEVHICRGPFGTVAPGERELAELWARPDFWQQVPPR